MTRQGGGTIKDRPPDQKKFTFSINHPHGVPTRQLETMLGDLCVVPTFNWKQPSRPWVKPAASTNDNRGSRSPHAFDARYHTTRWRRLRAEVLERSPLCDQCFNDGRVTAAHVVDHIVRVRDGGSFWDIDNLQPMCHRCHNSKSGREAHGAQGH